MLSQNFKLKVKLDSNVSFIDSTKTKKVFNSKNDVLYYLDSISNSFSFKGFFNNYYTLKKEKNLTLASFTLGSKIDSIQIFIKEGEIDFSKFKTPINFLSLKSIEISTDNTTSFLNETSTYFENLGNSFTKVRLANLILKQEKIQAELLVEISPQRTINKIVIQGYTEISKKFLKKRLQLSNKVVFNKKTIIDIDKRISSIPFLEQIKPPEILFTKDSTYLYVYLKKKNNNYINGIIGFSTNTENSIVLNGDLDLKLSNIFNGGENINLNWKSYNNNSTLFTKLNLPIIFTPKVSIEGNFNLTKQDTLYTTNQGKLNLIYNINEHHSIGGIATFENSNLINPTITENYLNYKKNGIGVTYSFSAFINESSIPVHVLISYISGKKNNIEKQDYAQLLVENIFSINNKNNIYFKLTGELLNSSNISKNELLKIGGYNSIRGFEEYSIYATKFAFSNIEYRYHINNKNFFYTISDIAFTNNVINSEKKSLLGIGFGYLFTTKNSILNFSYVTGHKLNSAEKNRKSKVYLNISYLF